MNIKYKALFVALIFSPFLYAQECSHEAIQHINLDESKTTFQKQHAVDQLCMNKEAVFEGQVVDVAKGKILISKEKRHIDIRLSQSHGCGDLVKINKGDKLVMRGTMTHMWPGIRKYKAKDGRCVVK